MSQSSLEQSAPEVRKTTVPVPAPKAARSASIDLLKILSAYGIVWFHSGAVSFRLFAYAGLPIFVMLTAILSAQSASKYPLGQFARQRAWRLLEPWLVWCLIYLLLWVGYNTLRNKPMHWHFKPNMLLVGTATHLWYLPFALGIGLISYGLLRITARVAPSLVVPVVFLGAVAGMTPIWGWIHHGEMPEPFGQWLFSAPAVLLGFGMFLATHRRPKAGLTAAMIWPGAALGILTLAMASGFIAPEVALPYVVALAAILVALNVTIRSNAIIEFLAPLSFGIYLIHIAVIPFTEQLLKRYAGPEVCAVLNMVASTVLAWLILKTPLRRWVS